jgi:hypothetical protein
MYRDSSYSYRRMLGACGVFVAIALSASLFQKRVWAFMSQEDYLSALKIADSYVQRKQGQAPQGRLGLRNQLRSTLSVTSVNPYKVGDHWTVAAYHSQPVVMRKTDDADQLKEPTGKVGIFRYEVTAVQGEGLDRQVTLKVVQVESHGKAKVDPRVDSLQLTLGGTLKQQSKAYRLQSRNELIAVSPDGLRSRISALELFPLDMPDILSAERARPEALPELPQALDELATRASFKPELARSTWFEQEDFFGRAVQMLWQQGDPWPAYLKTPHGVSILIDRGTQ